jgi:hypothetical protein
VFCDGISAAGISASDLPVDAAKDAPAIPNTDTALLGRFPFEARFACDIAEFLSIEQMCGGPAAHLAHLVRFEYDYSRPIVNASHRKLSYFRHAAGARQTVDATVCGFPSWKEVSAPCVLPVGSGVTLMRLLKPTISVLTCSSSKAAASANCESAY